MKNRKQQIVFLRNVRKMIRTHPSLIPSISSIFDKLYDADLIEEETFLVWNKNESEKEDELSESLVEKAKPFIDWLQKEEDGSNKSDDDEDSDEDDDDDSDEDSD